MLIGCDKCNENTPITPVTPANTSELIPLAKGNYWKMEGLPDSNNVKKTSYLYCLRDTVISGLTWWIMSPDNISTTTGGPGTGTILYRNDNKGLNQIFFYTGSRTEDLTYKYPAIKGEKYDVNGSEVTIESTDNVVTFGSKQFSNVILYINKFSIFGFTSYSYTYICPGIGIVKIENYSETQSKPKTLVSYFELIEYKIN